LKQFRSRALGPALSETSVAPFPFLPLPIPSCPHDRAYAQGGESRAS
jgi:protoheme IX farnesyltransferase